MIFELGRVFLEDCVFCFFLVEEGYRRGFYEIGRVGERVGGKEMYEVGL